MARDYKKEYREYHSTPEQKKNRAQRNAARRAAIKRGSVKKGDGREVDHKIPIRKGGGNQGNTRVVDAAKNRGWRKGKKGYD
jgi:5-methylcytosine-specific restriction endonuclease McrA